MKVFDLKIGMLCNNNCIHCVVANRRELAERNPDMKYAEIIKFFDTVKLEEYDGVVITGGEPTAFPFLGRLLKYITKTYPHLNVCLQTNGRLLPKFVNDFKDLYDANANVRIVIAIHADTAELHDFITNVPNSNSFNQTVEAIKLFSEKFGEKFDWRSETVLSRYNIHRIVDICRFAISLSPNVIGFSYPHLDGYAVSNDFNRGVTDIGFDYDQLSKHIPELTTLINEHPDIPFMLEEFPPCLWLSHGLQLPNLDQVNLTTLYDKGDSVLSYMGELKEDDFNTQFLKSRRHYPRCSECVWCDRCTGIWFESHDNFDNKCLQPIKSEMI